MDLDTIETLVWAKAHPFLYTFIKIKAALVAAAVASVARQYFKYLIAKEMNRNGYSQRKGK